MKKIWFFVVVIATPFGFAGCEKADIKTVQVFPKTQLLFHTNAQEFVNCGQWDVEVYVDSIYQGKLEYPLSNIDCDSEVENEPAGGKLLITLEGVPPTTIKYYAKPTKCLTSNVEGEIALKKGECNKIFLDFYGTDGNSDGE